MGTKPVVKNCKNAMSSEFVEPDAPLPPIQITPDDIRRAEQILEIEFDELDAVILSRDVQQIRQRFDAGAQIGPRHVLIARYAAGLPLEPDDDEDERTGRVIDFVRAVQRFVQQSSWRRIQASMAARFASGARAQRAPQRRPRPRETEEGRNVRRRGQSGQPHSAGDDEEDGEFVNDVDAITHSSIEDGDRFIINFHNSWDPASPPQRHQFDKDSLITLLETNSNDQIWNAIPAHDLGSLPKPPTEEEVLNLAQADAAGYRMTTGSLQFVRMIDGVCTVIYLIEPSFRKLIAAARNREKEVDLYLICPNARLYATFGVGTIHGQNDPKRVYGLERDVAFILRGVSMYSDWRVLDASPTHLSEFDKRQMMAQARNKIFITDKTETESFETKTVRHIVAEFGLRFLPAKTRCGQYISRGCVVNATLHGSSNMHVYSPGQLTFTKWFNDRTGEVVVTFQSGRPNEDGLHIGHFYFMHPKKNAFVGELHVSWSQMGAFVTLTTLRSMTATFKPEDPFMIEANARMSIFRAPTVYKIWRNVALAHFEDQSSAGDIVILEGGREYKTVLSQRRLLSSEDELIFLPKMDGRAVPHATVVDLLHRKLATFIFDLDVSPTSRLVFKRVVRRDDDGIETPDLELKFANGDIIYPFTRAIVFASEDGDEEPEELIPSVFIDEPSTQPRDGSEPFDWTIDSIAQRIPVPNVLLRASEEHSHVISEVFRAECGPFLFVEYSNGAGIFARRDAPSRPILSGQIVHGTLYADGHQIRVTWKRQSPISMSIFYENGAEFHLPRIVRDGIEVSWTIDRRGLVVDGVVTEMQRAYHFEIGSHQVVVATVEGRHGVFITDLTARIRYANKIFSLMRGADWVAFKEDGRIVIITANEAYPIMALSASTATHSVRSVNPPNVVMTSGDEVVAENVSLW